MHAQTKVSLAHRAANDLICNWGPGDLEFWTVTFSGLAKPLCVVCFSPYHSHRDCQTLLTSNPELGPYASDLTIRLGVPPVLASSNMSVDAAIPPATPSSAVKKVTLERTRATSGIRAQALANAARDKVHLQARNKTPPVSTPIDINVLERELSQHPNHNFVTNLVNGYGTPVSYIGPEKSQVSHNLISATQHPEVLSTDLAKEINLGWVAGPFDVPPLPNLQCHPVGVVLKKHSTKWHTIYHLSYPEGDSLNDYIPKDP